MMKAGSAIVFGEAAVRALGADDPAIRSNSGFSYEILPMLQAVVRPG